MLAGTVWIGSSRNSVAETTTSCKVLPAGSSELCARATCQVAIADRQNARNAKIARVFTPAPYAGIIRIRFNGFAGPILRLRLSTPGHQGRREKATPGF